MSKTMRFLPLVIFALIVGVSYVMLTASSEGTRDTKAIGFSMTNAPVPDLILPKFQESGTIDLADWKGKAYAINVFASWCGPCKLEASSIDAMAEDLPVIGINYRDDPEAARDFLNQFGNPYQEVSRDTDGNYSIQLLINDKVINEISSFNNTWVSQGISNNFNNIPYDYKGNRGESPLRLWIEDQRDDFSSWCSN